MRPTIHKATETAPAPPFGELCLFAVFVVGVPLAFWKAVEIIAWAAHVVAGWRS